MGVVTGQGRSAARQRLAVGVVVVAAAVVAASCDTGNGSAPPPSPVLPRSPASSPPAGPVSPTAGPVSPTAAPRTAQPWPRLKVGTASWTLPAPVSREVVVSLGRSGVLAGGLTAGQVTTKRVYRVSADGVGAGLPALVQPVHDAAGALVGGRVVVVGGGNASEQSAVQAAVPGQAWRIVGHLPQARSDLAAVATAQGMLVIGGYDGVAALRPVLASGDGRTFTDLASLRSGVRYAAVAVVGGSLWVFGGEDAGRELRTTQVVDLATKRVRMSRPMPTALGHAAVAVIGGRILLMGGRTAPHQVTRTMWWCDPTTGRFTRAGLLPYPVADTGVLNLPGAVYLLGGESPATTARVIEVTSP